MKNDFKHPPVTKVGWEPFPTAKMAALEAKVLSINCLAELNCFANRRDLIPDGATAWTVEQAEIIIAHRDNLRLGICQSCDWEKCSSGIGSMVVNPDEEPFQTVADTVAEPPTAEMLERRRVSESWQARLDELEEQYEAARNLRLKANAERLRDEAKPQQIKSTTEKAGKA